MGNNYVPYFNRIDFLVIPSYIELPSLKQAQRAAEIP